MKRRAIIILIARIRFRTASTVTNYLTKLDYVEVKKRVLGENI